MELKNKPKVVYSLIVLVIVIWVSIFIRIFTFESSQPNSVIYQKRTSSKSNDKVKKKHFVLLLNYSDPFVCNSSTQSTVSNNPTEDDYSFNAPLVTMSNLSSNNKTLDASADFIPDVHYVGMLGNSTKDKIVAILKIAQKKYILSEGDTCQEIQIISILRDSIIVSFAKKKLVFHKKR